MPGIQPKTGHPRTILHLDLDAFYCAVEEQHNPTLRGLPFAVGGKPTERGVVASCSYAARRLGVRSALPMSQAVRLCPALIVVPPRFPAYHEASEKVMACLHDLTPFVEQISIDEAFLDVTLLHQDGGTLARRLQATIRERFGLPCSLGVATNKLVAKIATTVGKAAGQRDAPPNAIRVVPPGQEAAFLAPLPVIELWGVGPKTAEHLGALGIHTIGALARWDQADLIQRFGKNGADLYFRAQGIDERPVESEVLTKSVSKEVTFTHDLTDKTALKRTLRHLADGVGQRLRAEALSGTTIKLKLRWSDFTTLTRQITLEHPTSHDNVIYDSAARLLDAIWTPGRAVRLIGVGVSGFETPNRQMGLWEVSPPKEPSQLETALDDLRTRFGDQIIRRGSDLLDESE